MRTGLRAALAATLLLLLTASCNRPFVFIQLTDTQIGFGDKTEGYVWSDSLMCLAVDAVNRVRPACVIITGEGTFKVTSYEEYETKKVTTKKVKKIVTREVVDEVYDD